MNRYRKITLQSLALCTLVGACGRQQLPPSPSQQGASSDDKSHQPFILKTYEYTPGTQERVRSVLSKLKTQVVSAAGGKTSTASVRLKPVFVSKGKFALSAPVGVHRGVQEIAQALTEEPVTARKTIELTYWLVLGDPAAASPTIDPQLSEVRPAIDKLAQIRPMWRHAAIKKVQARLAQKGWHRKADSDG